MQIADRLSNDNTETRNGDYLWLNFFVSLALIVFPMFNKRFKFHEQKLKRIELASII